MGKRFQKHRNCRDLCSWSTLPLRATFFQILLQILKGKSFFDKNVGWASEGSRNLLSQLNFHCFNIALPTARFYRAVSKFEVRFPKHQMDSCELLGSCCQWLKSFKSSPGVVIREVCSVLAMRRRRAVEFNYIGFLNVFDRGRQSCQFHSTPSTV